MKQLLCLMATPTLVFAIPAYAEDVPSPGIAVTPMAELRLRNEAVDQPTLNADAVTARVRAGVELKHRSSLSLLAEGEGTLALTHRYNAFPFAIADEQRRPGFATVADPESVDLNRLQLQWKGKDVAVTLGRQRINLDDQRWVGNSGWRQNEQTFDAVRAEARLGPVAFDGSYAVSQRTIYGSEAGSRRGYDGDFTFLGAGAKVGPAQVKAFAYLLDYSEPFVLANSSQTYGARAVVAVPLGQAKLNLAASYARQRDFAQNPTNYSANYLAAEAGLAFRGISLSTGFEKLGSDAGHAAVQTPMATLHKFQGWADMFLTTPTAGLKDTYGGAGYTLTSIPFFKGLAATVVYHRFVSDFGGVHYGDEWDASLGFKLGRFAVLGKFADYRPARFGTKTRKFWLQTETSL